VDAGELSTALLGAQATYDLRVYVVFVVAFGPILG
jgi:hypothetical protein